ARAVSSAALNDRRLPCLETESTLVLPGCRNILKRPRTSRGFSYSRDVYPVCSETDGARSRNNHTILERPFWLPLPCRLFRPCLPPPPNARQDRSKRRPKFRPRSSAFSSGLLPLRSCRREETARGAPRARGYRS